MIDVVDRLSDENEEASSVTYELGVCCLNGIGVKEDRKKAFQCFHRVSEQGNGRAMCSIGKCYESGIGIEPDEKKAIESYERATEMGDSEAMCILGEYYLNGICVGEDKKKAVELFKRASELGNPRAKSNLDFNRELVEKVEEEKEKKERFERMKKAAEDGDVESIFNLGKCYLKGEGVEMDKKKAIELRRRILSQICNLSQTK